MIALLSAKIVTVTMKLTTSGAPFEFLSNWNNWNETKRNCLIEYVERSLELKKVLATTWVKIVVYVVRESIHICRMWRNFAPTCFINLVKHTCKWDNFYAILVFFCIHCLPECFYAQVFKRYKITKRDLPIRSPAKRRQTFFFLDETRRS